MSYRCECCEEHVPHGQPRRLHTVRGKKGNVARELAVCEGCLLVLGRYADNYNRFNELRAKMWSARTGAKAPAPRPHSVPAVTVLPLTVTAPFNGSGHRRSV